jgi:sulfur carrier protein
MHIFLNGEPRNVPDNITAAQLLETLQLTGKRLAMEVNQEIVPRSQFPEFTLKADDRVEIVHAIGGG